MISFTTLRSTVVLSAGLLLSGVLLLLIAESAGLPVPTAHLSPSSRWIAAVSARLP
jgi:hypothetical protein